MDARPLPNDLARSRHRRCLPWLALFLLFVPASASAQGPDENLPLPVPEPTETARRFHETGHYYWIFGRFWDVAVPLALLVWGGSARLRDLAVRLSRGRRFAVVPLYVSMFLTIVFLADLPWRYFAGFVRLHAYDLSNQTFAKWLGDNVKSLAVDVAGAAAFAWVPFWLIGRYPRAWWWIVSALFMPFLMFVMLITPVWIDPLFNEFGPMKDKALEAKILALASRAGIEGGRVFEVAKSVDTKTTNAYVTGFLGSKRIVLWDTLLNKFGEREILAVMGHEMGHYALNHVARSIVLSSIVVLAGLFWTDRAGRRLLARFGPRWGLTGLSDVAATPLLLVLLAVSSVALAPIVMAYSRHQEHEADRFALELTRFNHSAANAFASFQRENLAMPYSDPLCKLFRATHPSLGERIEFCNAYHPWVDGQPLSYGHLFIDETDASAARAPSGMP